MLSRITLKLLDHLRPYQVVYMMLFSVYGVWANMHIGSYIRVFAAIYLVMSVGSLFVLLPAFRRALFHVNDPLREHRLAGKPLSLFGTRVYTYIVLPIFLVALLQVFSAISGALLQFHQSNVQPSPHPQDFIVPVFAGMEEVWRWSMIVTVLVCGRFLFRSRWKNRYIRLVWLLFAIVASSVGFGSGHIMEFHSDRLGALALFSVLGILLAFYALLTGRILLVMCVHVLYDLWVTILAASHGHHQLFGLLIYISLLLAPICTLIWRQSLVCMKRPLADDVRLVYTRADSVSIFDSESNRIRHVFRRRKLCFIDHIGSTAVGEMIGDDSIDIQVSVRAVKLTRSERREIEELGYRVYGRVGVRGRIFLRKTGEPNVHVHLVEVMGPFAHASLRLKSYLNTFGVARNEWQEAKRELVDHGSTKLRTYIDAKQDPLMRLIDESYRTHPSTDH